MDILLKSALFYQKKGRFKKQRRFLLTEREAGYTVSLDIIDWKSSFEVFGGGASWGSISKGLRQ